MINLQRNRKSRLKNSRYITGIDGLRALAVIGVIVYHLLPFDLKGGYIGVPIFFVISGYLITDLFMKEWDQTGSINIVSFFYRRMRRLYPALVATVVGAGAYITLFQRNLLAQLRAVIWTNLLYVYNWFEIGHGQNYFERFQNESPFIHLWTLSIDGQFYLFWPFVMILLGLLFRHHRKLLGILFIALTAVGAWYMYYIYMQTNNINRVYYGTDTRMFSVFAGVALAYLWPADDFKNRISSLERTGIDLLGIGSLAGLIYYAFVMGGQSAWTYKYGMLIITILATVALAAICHPGADINRLMTNPIFHWLGTRSYGIYLYQLPVMVFYEARIHSQAIHPVRNAIIEIIIIGIISELSYRWLEKPLQHYNYSHFKQDFKDFFNILKWQHIWKHFIIVPVLIVFWICGVGAVQAPSHQVQTAMQKHITHNQTTISVKNRRLARHQPKSQMQVTPRQMKRPLNKSEEKVQMKYHLSKYQVLAARHFPMAAVGDSIMVDCSKDLQSIFTETTVKAKVGGQLSQAVSALKAAKANHNLAKNVLVNIGTNGPLTKKQIKEVIKLVGPHRNIYWITTHGPTKPYQNSNNAKIKAMAKSNHNFHVIDWYQASHRHSNYFWGDHIHPNPRGNKAFVRLITQIIFKK